MADPLIGHQGAPWPSGGVLGLRLCLSGGFCQVASTLNARNQGFQAGYLLLFTSLVSVFNVLADIQWDISDL